MSSKITVKPHSGVGAIGLISIIAGLIMIVVGAVAWGLVASQLAAENITVASDSKFMPNKNVNDPLSAFAQANAINEHAQAMSGGKTYAELDKDDPMREVVMNASFLRASLFTSVVAFGVSAFVMLVGLLAMISGWALRRMAGGPPLVIETSDSGPVEIAAAVRSKKGETVLDGAGGSPTVQPVTPVTPSGAKPLASETGNEVPNEAVPTPQPAVLPPTTRKSISETIGAQAGSATSGDPLPGQVPGPSVTPLSAAIPPAVPAVRQPVVAPAFAVADEQPTDRAQASKAHLTGTGSIPIVAVPPATGQGSESPDPHPEPQPFDTTRPAPPATGANGWGTPADRVPKQ